MTPFSLQMGRNSPRDLESTLDCSKSMRPSRKTQTEEQTRRLRMFELYRALLHSLRHRALFILKIYQFLIHSK